MLPVANALQAVFKLLVLEEEEGEILIHLANRGICFARIQSLVDNLAVVENGFVHKTGHGFTAC